MIKRILVLNISLALLTISACGGGDSNSSAMENMEETTQNTVLTGVFLDSAVEGVSYNTETFSGLTNASGEFQYLEGESVTFSIGNLELPEVLAQSEITPVDMSPTQSIDDNITVNVSRLLQSLDEDNNPSNGIKISAVAASSATQVDFSVSPEDFSNNSDVINLVANSGSSSTALIAPEVASAHLSTTLGQSDFVRIFSLDTLNREIVDREQLFENGDRFVIRSDNQLEVTNTEGSFVFGTWSWENSLFCRNIDPGDSGLPAFDCQIFELMGDVLRFTRNSGAGESLTVTLAGR